MNPAADSVGAFGAINTDAGGDDVSFGFIKTEQNGDLYFIGYASNNDLQLFKTNGTIAGTAITAPDIAPLINPLGNTGFFLDNGAGFYFAAEYTTVGNELYKISIAPDTNTAVTDIALNSLASVYPNPNNGIATLQLELPEREQVEYSLYTITGTRVMETEVQTLDAGKHLLPIDLSSQPQGMYLLKLTIANETAIQRIVRTE